MIHSDDSDEELEESHQFVEDMTSGKGKHLKSNEMSNHDSYVYERRPTRKQTIEMMKINSFYNFGRGGVK